MDRFDNKISRKKIWYTLNINELILLDGIDNAADLSPLMPIIKYTSGSLFFSTRDI